MIDKIKSFAKLEKGWDSYRAEPPSKLAIDTAIKVYEESHIPFRALASVEGGVALIYRDIFVEVYNDGDICVVWNYDQYDIQKIETLSIDDLIKKLLNR